MGGPDLLFSLGTLSVNTEITSRGFESLWER
jgi:hypothetical protein